MLNVIKKLFFNVIYILCIIYLLIYIPVLGGCKPLVVVSGSMQPLFKIGGIIYYKEIDINKYKINDIVVYKMGKDIISHRIVEIKENGFITMGDYNNTMDSYVVSKNQILGRSTKFSIPYLGYYAGFIYSHKYVLYFLIMIIILDFHIKDSKQ